MDKVLAWPVRGGAPARTLATLGGSEAFVGWSADAARIYVATWNGPQGRIESLDVTSGRRSSSARLRWAIRRVP